MIIKSTWNLLQDSVSLSLDAVPKGIDLPSLQAGLCTIEGVVSVDHIHIWPISTTDTAMTAHVLVKETSDFKRVEEIKKAIRVKLHEASIQHATLEVESYVVTK